MAKSLFRLSKHPLVRWWWSMDRMLVGLLLVLSIFGALVVSTASSAVATTYDVSPYYFAQRQWIFLFLAWCVFIVMSFFSAKQLQILGWLMFFVTLVALALTLVAGTDVKGASRWINIGGFSLQPSEFMKPALILVTAKLLSADDYSVRFRGFIASGALLGIVAILLISQPDFGMFMVLAMVWGGQVFLSGISWKYLTGLLLLPPVALAGAYFGLSHVTKRIDRFLDPDSGDSYQIDKAYEAFISGGMFGRGAGEGVVKHTLPDAHTDFVFAVIGEEFGVLMCLAVMFIYAMFIWRGYSKVMRAEDRFSMLAGGGILILLTIQVLVNMGVTLSIVPTTGMTLPFISYGGSSTMAMALVVGSLLSLIRKKRT